jgi:hypothetical protein
MIVFMENTFVFYTIYYIFSKVIISDRNMFCPTFKLSFMCFLHLTGLSNGQGVSLFSPVHVFNL